MALAFGLERLPGSEWTANNLLFCIPLAGTFHTEQ